MLKYIQEYILSIQLLKLLFCLLCSLFIIIVRASPVFDATLRNQYSNRNVSDIVFCLALNLNKLVDFLVIFFVRKAR